MYNAILTGLRTAGSGVNASNQKPDIDTVLKVLEPYQTPFLQYLFFSNKKSKPVYNKKGKFIWYEDEYLPHQTDVKVAITASGGTLTLTAANVSLKSIFGLDDVVYIEQNDEQAYVSSVTAGGGSDVVLTHMDGVTALSSVTQVGSFLKNIGFAGIEKNIVPTSITTQEAEVYNYLNIMTASISNTGRDQAGAAYTDGTTHAEQVTKKVKEMKLKVERYFMLSLLRGFTGTGANYKSYGIGLNGRITTNVLGGYGTLEENEWDDYLKTVGAKGSNKRKHYCGSDQLMEINKIVKDKLGALPNSRVTEYGVTLYTYYHPVLSGGVEIIHDPVLDGKFSNWGFTIDAGHVTPRHMGPDDKGSRKFRIEANVGDDGVDYKETKILMDLGVQIEQEETMGKIYS